LWQFVTGNELYHHGILGMRWGVRRWQYKDGSLTPAGKKRAAKLAKKYRETTSSEISPAVKTKRKIEDMSNEELAERVVRNRLEADYMRSLSDKQAMIKKTEPFIKKFTKETLLPKLASSLGDALKRHTDKIIDDLWEEKLGPAMGIDKYDMAKQIKSAKSKADLKRELNRIIEEDARKRMYDDWVNNDMWNKIYEDAFNKRSNNNNNNNNNNNGTP